MSKTWRRENRRRHSKKRKAKLGLMSVHNKLNALGITAKTLEAEIAAIRQFVGE
jgi:hypothetical protein